LCKLSGGNKNPAPAERHPSAVVALNVTVRVPAGTFRNCLQTQETTLLETDLLEQKYYAPGIGNVLTVNSRNGDRVELVRITTN